MKKSIGFALLLASAMVHSEQIISFPELVNAVTQGKKITFVLDVKQCTAPVMPNDITVSLSPDAIMLVNKTRITASDRHFTLDDPRAPGTPVISYSKYNLYSDGTASIKMTLMQASDYTVINTYQVNCALNKGFNVFSAG